jgi:large subunit ribosomal protein L19
MINQMIKEIEQQYMKKEVPDFRPGDTVRVAVRIVEGDKERTQNYEGVVIARHGTGMNETFTVRRVSFGVGMERTFTLHSPRVEEIKIVRHGRVRRAKLYYLRDLSGRKARIADTRRKRGAKDSMIQLLQAEGALDPPTADSQPEATQE